MRPAARLSIRRRIASPQVPRRSAAPARNRGRRVAQRSAAHERVARRERRITAAALAIPEPPYASSVRIVVVVVVARCRVEFARARGPPGRPARRGRRAPRAPLRRALAVERRLEPRLEPGAAFFAAACFPGRQEARFWGNAPVGVLVRALAVAHRAVHRLAEPLARGERRRARGNRALTRLGEFAPGRLAARRIARRARARAVRLERLRRRGARRRTTPASRDSTRPGTRGGTRRRHAIESRTRVAARAALTCLFSRFRFRARLPAARARSSARAPCAFSWPSGQAARAGACP